MTGALHALIARFGFHDLLILWWDGLLPPGHGAAVIVNASSKIKEPMDRRGKYSKTPQKNVIVYHLAA